MPHMAKERAPCGFPTTPHSTFYSSVEDGKDNQVGGGLSSLRTSVVLLCQGLSQAEVNGTLSNSRTYMYVITD